MRSLALAFILVLMGYDSAQALCARNTTQLAMNECAHKVYKASDSRMNSIYRRAMRAQNREHKLDLRQAQRAWVRFRDQACESYSNLGDGGSIRPLLFSTCLSSLTNERSKMLQYQTIGFGR